MRPAYFDLLAKINTMKPASIIIILLCSFLIALQATAQKNYWEKAEAKYQSDYRQRIVDNMNMKPGKAVTIPGSDGRTPEFMKTKEQKAADAAYLADVKQREAAAYEREQDRIISHQLYLQRIAQENATNKQNTITQFYDAAKKNVYYSDIDLRIASQDYFYFRQDNRVPKGFDRYMNAVDRGISKILTDSLTMPLDTLLTHIWNSRLFPATSIGYLKKLQKQFPTKKEYMEKIELEIMPYFFGASTPYVSSPIGYTYPLCGFEMMGGEEQKALLNRFEELESAYPEMALKMAGNCRHGFNPFYKYATSNLPLANKTSAKRLSYLYNTLATIQQDYILPAGGFKEATWRYSADQMLRAASKEIKLIYPGFVDSLSAQQWLDIATASKLNVKYIAWAFRDDNDAVNYLKKLPNLTNALKEEFKKEEDGDGTITFKNRDTYKGEIKDGKPNGKGKYKSATGDRYEGFFKDGYLHGSGRSYSAKNIGDGKNRIIYEGDDYTGEFDNGARHGKGTLVNKSRSNHLYVGDWVNGKKDGEGEESYSGNLTYQYKGSFKKGSFEGMGTCRYYDTSVYTGQFKSGAWDGKGIVTYKDGSTLKGDWEQGYLDGKGILTSAKGYIMQYVNEIEKKKHKGKVYSRSFSQKNIKYYSPDGKEITEGEYDISK